MSHSVQAITTLDEALERGISPVFQPIVDLSSGATVGFEALARGPRGSALESPAALFAAAAAERRIGELDDACRHAALVGAHTGGMSGPLSLFVNAEPEGISAASFAALPDPPRGVPVVVELTERALTSRPAEMLAVIEVVRRRGWRVALDDVGADTRSLALLSLVRPDVVKLDLRLVQDRTTPELAAVSAAVCAYAEATGAWVVAEGIETEEHRRLALSLGAQLGQGWHFGRPGALARPAELARMPLPRVTVPAAAGATPFDTLAALRPVRRGDKSHLLATSLLLEQRTAMLGEQAMIVAAFQSADRFTPATRRRYADLAERAALVGALGVGMEAEPAPGVRGASLDPDDALMDEWSVVVLSPHYAAALVAVDLGDAGPDGERRYDFALTHDRSLCVAAARTLVARVAAG